MKILLVDDELENLRAVIKAMEADGHSVRTIKNPYEARSMIQKEPNSFQLAIIDKAMSPNPAMIPADEYPEADDFQSLGLTLVHLICQKAPRRPVILLSAYLVAQDYKELEDFENVVVLDKGGATVLDAMLNHIRKMRYSVN
jgi:CheY-like chemotaxis protein